MKQKLLMMALLLMANALTASAQITGYFNLGFMTGSNLFDNPLQSSGPNTLSAILSSSNVASPYTAIPQGTTASLWNPTNDTFGNASLFTNGAWTVDFPLLPGTGVLVVCPSAFNFSCGGTVLNPDGSIYTGDNFPLPPVFSGKNGLYLLGDKYPLGDVGTNIFLNILGRLPYAGEQVRTLSMTSTYLGNGNWDVVPTLNTGQSAFLNVLAPLPVLSIVYANHQAIVSWPSGLTGWTLQTNNNLSTGNWGDYAGTVVNNIATNPPATGNLFFRLMHP